MEEECSQLIGSVATLFARIDSNLELLQHENDYVHLKSLLGDFESFQEAPQYLDPKISSWMDTLVSHALLDLEADSWVYKVIYALSKIRGYKVITKFFPNDAHLLPLLVTAIENCTKTTSWEHRYSLLLWLGILILIPIPLSSFDSGLAERIYVISKQFSSVPGKERDAACLALARTLAREDTINLKFLDQYVDECINQWPEANLFQKLGYLHCFAFLQNLTSNSQIYKLLPILEQCVTENNSTICKLAAKNLGRMALNLLKSDSDQENIEMILDSLLLLLESKDTIVRYTTSKAISRIILRLPVNFQEDVINLILELFGRDVLGDNYSQVASNLWHGLLLTIAELLRRKVLSFDQLTCVVKILKISLFFEQKKITHALGANVRDASCYVCWSLFRSYSDLPSSILTPLFDSLVLLCCYDREFTIRRAASAAVQEGVGRQNHHFELERGISLVQLLDYFKLGSRTYAVSEISVSLQGLRFEVVSDAIKRVATSWGPEMRRLYAIALRKLTNGKDTTDIVDKLFNLYNKNDVDAKHGVLLALGELGVKSPRAVQLLNELTENELKLDFGPLIAEGFLSVYRNFDNKQTPELLQRLSACLEFSEPPVVRLAEITLYDMELDDEIVDSWLERAKDAKGCFIQALGSVKSPSLAIIKGLENLSRSPIVSVRADAIKNLYKLVIKAPEKLDMFDFTVYVNGLSDYTVDSRGDVGSWVRLASINASETIYSHLEQKYQIRVMLNLVRMSVEINGKVRQVAYDILQKLDIEILRPILKQYHSGMSTKEYYQHWLQIYDTNNNTMLQMEFTRGLVTSVGGIFASETTLKQSLLALVSYLRSKKTPMSFYKILISTFDGSTAKVVHSILKTFSHLLESGLYFPTYEEDPKFHESLYGRASFIFDKAKSSAIKVTCIRIFGGLAGLGNVKALKRLGHLCGHSVSAIRVESSETLYQVLVDLGDESGTLELLEEVDWGRSLGDITDQFKKLEMQVSEM